MLTSQRPTSTIFGTKEWAKYNVNIINGCEHDCRYCYSKEMAIRFKRKSAKNWKIETLNNKKVNRRYGKFNGRVMFPSSHDITPKYLSEYIKILHQLLINNNEVLIVTKPHLKCIKEICRECIEFKNNVIFRFTIGSIDSRTLKYWEPGAPSFKERFKSLIYAYTNNYRTSVSCEPMLDSNTNELVAKLLPYITDSIWIGKANFLLKRLKLNEELNTASFNNAMKLLKEQDFNYINQLYQFYKTNHKIQWKDSIKRILGLKIPSNDA